MWAVKFKRSVKKDLAGLDRQHLRRIKEFLMDTVSVDPKAVGKPPRGHAYPFWIYRVGDYRIICCLFDAEKEVLVLRVGHRGKVYKQFPGKPDR